MHFTKDDLHSISCICLGCIRASCNYSHLTVGHNHPPNVEYRPWMHACIDFCYSELVLLILRFHEWNCICLLVHLGWFIWDQHWMNASLLAWLHSIHHFHSHWTVLSTKFMRHIMHMSKTLTFHLLFVWTHRRECMCHAFFFLRLCWRTISSILSFFLSFVRSFVRSIVRSMDSSLQRAIQKGARLKKTETVDKSQVEGGNNKSHRCCAAWNAYVWKQNC